MQFLDNYQVTKKLQMNLALQQRNANYFNRLASSWDVKPLNELEMTLMVPAKNASLSRLMGGVFCLAMLKLFHSMTSTKIKSIQRYFFC